jgi:membrane protein
MEKKVSKFQRFRENAQALLDDQTLRPHTELKRWHKFVHFWVLVSKSFVRNRCPVRASALAYGTVLALIPMLAVVVSITSSFLKKEGEDDIDRFIAKMVASLTPPADLPATKPKLLVGTNSPSFRTNGLTIISNATEELDQANVAPADSETEATNHVAVSEPTESVDPGTNTNGTAGVSFANAEATVKARRATAHYIHQFIRNTRSGALGVTGSVLLIFVAITMLCRIEDTFNDIWGNARGRSWFMRIFLYWGVLSLVPMLLAVAFGLATGPHLQSTRRSLATMPFISHMVMPLVFQVLPAVLLCLAFAILYSLIPNTKVHWRAALVGGLVGGGLFHLNNLVSVLYVSRVVSNSKIYGSLGLVPVFMIGLYLSWLIFLFGAQVAYAFQNRASYLEEKQLGTINQRGREFVALRLMTFIGRRFVQGEPPPSVVEIGEDLVVPTRLVQNIMQILSGARLVVETAGADPAYLPARPLECITCHDILLAMRASQGQELATRDEPTRAEVYGEFHRIQEAERQAASSVTMLALIARAQAHVGEPAVTGRLSAPLAGTDGPAPA